MWFVKAIGAFLIGAMALGMVDLWYRTYLLGGMYLNASLFLNLIVAPAPIYIVVGAGYVIKQIITFKLES